MFSNIFHRFSKICIIHQLKKSSSISFFAFFLRSVFISTYGLSQTFWLNLINLWTFFKTNLLFNSCFKLLLWIIYLVLSCKFDFSIFQAFRLFQPSSFRIKMVNHYKVHVIFQDIKHQLQDNILHQYLHSGFLMKSSLNSELSSIHSKLLSGSFWLHCLSI